MRNIPLDPAECELLLRCPMMRALEHCPVAIVQCHLTFVDYYSRHLSDMLIEYSL